MKTNTNTAFVFKSLLLIFLICCSIRSSNCNAESSPTNLLNADPQKLARGIGHFERARSLLLAAIREFDTGYEFVKTDQVIDTDLWRKTLLSRAEELESVLSPKPREIGAGSRYQPDSRILGPRIQPKANLKENSVVKPDAKVQGEAKINKGQTESHDSLDLSTSGS